jgi:site-specific recombinase XerD
LAFSFIGQNDVILMICPTVSSHNLRKTFATRLLSRGAAITDVQHLLGHASVKTTERAYAVFVKNERFKQTNDLLDEPVLPKLKIVK